MKSAVFALSLFLFPFSGFAGSGDLAKAEYYRFNGWVGEYPNGFELRTNLKVNTVASPENSLPGEPCVLKKHSVIHPWAEKTKSEFVTLWPISVYKAVKNFEMRGDGTGAGVKIKEGQEVLELTYLSEGFCLYSVEGKEIEDACLESTKNAVRVSTSPFSEREFFKTACSSGREAWIEASQLQKLVEQKSPAVRAAHILEFGKVQEP